MEGNLERFLEPPWKRAVPLVGSGSTPVSSGMFSLGGLVKSLLITERRKFHGCLDIFSSKQQRMIDLLWSATMPPSIGRRFFVWMAPDFVRSIDRRPHFFRFLEILAPRIENDSEKQKMPPPLFVSYPILPRFFRATTAIQATRLALTSWQTKQLSSTTWAHVKRQTWKLRGYLNFMSKRAPTQSPNNRFCLVLLFNPAKRFRKYRYQRACGNLLFHMIHSISHHKAFIKPFLHGNISNRERIERNTTEFPSSPFSLNLLLCLL